MEQFQSKIVDRSKWDDQHAREEDGDDEQYYTSEIDYEAGKGVIGIYHTFRLYQKHQ
jgi:hypothetical protein